MKIIYAEDLPYWKTGEKLTPDDWITKACKVIETLGGVVQLKATGRVNDRVAFILHCKIGGDDYRITFPVLPCRRKGQENYAERQAATMLYHHVKALAVSAKILGVRSAFAGFLMLPSGITVSEMTNQDVSKVTSYLLPAANEEFIEGEIV